MMDSEGTKFRKTTNENKKMMVKRTCDEKVVCQEGNSPD